LQIYNKKINNSNFPARAKAQFLAGNSNMIGSRRDSSYTERTGTIEIEFVAKNLFFFFKFSRRHAIFWREIQM